MQIQKGSEMKTKYVLDDDDIKEAILKYLQGRGLVSDNVVLENCETVAKDSSVSEDPLDELEVEFFITED